MKFLLSVIALLLLPLAASAQTTVSCPPNTTVCQPGAPGCQCAMVEQAPPVVVQQQPPNCPAVTGNAMAYYNGSACVVPAPVYQPPVYIPPYNPWENVPFNQQPGWFGPHPGVTQVPGGWIGPGGHFHPR